MREGFIWRFCLLLALSALLAFALAGVAVAGEAEGEEEDGESADSLPAVDVAATADEDDADEEDKPTYAGDEIVVTGTRTKHAVSDAPVATSVVNEEDIQKSGSDDVGDALENVPGVFVDEWESASRGGPGSGVNLQGLPTDRVLVLIDGQRVPMAMRAPDLELIPAALIRRIEVVKGPSSSLYGSDALGGVINLLTRNPSDDPRAELDFSGGSFTTFGGNAFHSWSAGPVGWVVNFNREQSEGWIDANAARSIVRIGEGVVDTLPQPFEDGHPYETNDLFGKATLQTGPHLRWTASSRYHWEDNQFTDVDQGSVSDDKIRFSGLLQGELNYGPVTMTAMAGYFHRVQRYREFSTNYTINPFDDDEYIRGVVNKGNTTVGDDAEGELMVSAALADWNLLTGGVAWRQERLDYEAFEHSALAESDQAYNAYQTVVSAYAQDELFFFDGIWSIVPGVRVDNHPDWGTTVNPKLSTLVKLPANTALRASVGRGFGEPSLSQMYRPIFRHSGYFLVGNHDLEPETALGANAEVEHGISNKAKVTAGYFRYELSDMIYPEIVNDNFKGGFPLMTYVNLKRARVQGAEGSLMLWPVQYVRWQLSYTYTKTYDLDENTTLGTSPEHNAGTRLFVDYDPWGLGGFASAAFQSERDYIGMGGRWYTADARWLTGARVYKTLGRHVELALKVDNWLGFTWDREGDGDNDLPPTGYYGELSIKY
jgi:outer membrane receptor for ferrienterochelin and colicins